MPDGTAAQVGDRAEQVRSCKTGTAQGSSDIRVQFLRRAIDGTCVEAVCRLDMLFADGTAGITCAIGMGGTPRPLGSENMPCHRTKTHAASPIVGGKAI